MAKILLNTRASRITIVDNILLLPAEIKKDERLGNVVSPSRTLISQRGKPSPYDRIMGCQATQKLFAAKIIEWSDEKAEEPDEPAALSVAAPTKNDDSEAAKAAAEEATKAAAEKAATEAAASKKTEGGSSKASHKSG